MSDNVRHVNLDSRQIRVLAHPLRSRLLSQLRLNGAATATKLAEVLGTNTGATSYHLRQLAEVGLVAEDAGAGHGRERWWRAAHDVTSWERDNFAGDLDAQAASDWLTSNFAHQLAERIEDWNAAIADEPVEWRAAAAFSDYIIPLGPAQLTRDARRAQRGHRRPLAAQREPAPDARQVLLYLYRLPRMEQS